MKTYWAVFTDEELATDFMGLPILGETKGECSNYKNQYVSRRSGTLGHTKVTVRKVCIVEVTQ